MRCGAIYGSRRGTAAIEFALVAPLLLLLTAGIVEFGRIYVVYDAIDRIASQYAIAWADCTDSPAGACQTEISSYASTNTLTNFTPQIFSARLTLQMFQITMSGTTPTIVYASPTGATLSSAQTSLAQSTFSSGQSAVIVTATYSHSLAYFPTFMTRYLGAYLTPSFTVAQLK